MTDWLYRPKNKLSQVSWGGWRTDRLTDWMLTDWLTNDWLTDWLTDWHVIQVGDHDHGTSNARDYDRKNAERVKAYQPQNTGLATGDFDGNTTNKIEYPGKQGERAKGYRPENKLNQVRTDWLTMTDWLTDWRIDWWLFIIIQIFWPKFRWRIAQTTKESLL